MIKIISTDKIIIRNLKGGESQEITVGTKRLGEKNNITKEIKPELKEAISRRGLKVGDVLNLDIKYLEEYTSNMEVFSELMQGKIIKEPVRKKCFFLEENEAWIYRNPDTYQYWYLSSDSTNYFHLNVIDIFILFSDKKYGEVVTELLTAFGFKTEEERWKSKQTEKYRENIKEIKRGNEWEKKYPNFYKLAKSTLKTLTRLNIVGMENVVGINEQVGMEAVFFSSTRYLSSLTKTGRTTIMNHINLLSLLGLVKKPTLEELPKHLLNATIKRVKGKKINTINYYTIPEINKSLMSRADSIAVMMIEAGINIRNLNRKKVSEFFGEQVAFSIYENSKGGGGKRKSERVKEEVEIPF